MGTDHSVDYKIKHKNKKDKNRVVSSVTIFLKSPKETTNSDKQKYFTREELLKLQYPCPNLSNPFAHVFDEIDRNTASIMREMSRNEQQEHKHQKQTKRPVRKHTTGFRCRTWLLIFFIEPSN